MSFCIYNISQLHASESDAVNKKFLPKAIPRRNKQGQIFVEGGVYKGTVTNCAKKAAKRLLQKQIFNQKIVLKLRQKKTNKIFTFHVWRVKLLTPTIMTFINRCKTSKIYVKKISATFLQPYTTNQ